MSEKQIAPPKAVQAQAENSGSTSPGRTRRGSVALGMYADDYQKYFNSRRIQLKHEDLMAEIKSELVRSKGVYQNNLGQIRELQRDITHLKQIIAENRSTQLDYYFALLEGGVDTRNFGLSWIIK